MSKDTEQITPLAAMRKVGITHAFETLLWAPRKHVDYTCLCQASELPDMIDQRVMLALTIGSEPIKHPTKKGAFHVWVVDGAGAEHRLTVFGDVRYTPWKQIPVGDRTFVVCKPSLYNERIYLNGPELVPAEWAHRVMPVYAGKAGVLAAAVVAKAVGESIKDNAVVAETCFAIREAFSGMEEADILQLAGIKGNLALLLYGLHNPRSMQMAEWAMKSARKLAVAYVKHSAEQASHRPLRMLTMIRTSEEDVRALMARLPFSPTTGERSQEQAIVAIARLLAEPYAMDAILSADVGVGKTLCYMVPSVAAQAKGARVCILVPNTILAEQIAGEFRHCFPECPVALVTDATKGVAIDWEENPIIVATTRIFSVAKRAKWHPNLLVIDEQQKMSVEQREALCTEDTNVLEASATPLPQTLALLQYGGKDRIEVDKRHAQQTIHSYVVDQSHRQRMFAKLKETVEAGYQVAVIYPRVEGKSEDDVKSVITAGERFERLCPGQVIVLHGKLSTEAKLEAMQLAREGQKKIVVASSIIEIGITIENLRMLIVVEADRYGVSTLHQFRGRLARKGGEAWFFAYLPREVEEETLARVELLTRTTNGFELAELDMQQRGFGDLGRDGTATSGKARTLFRSIELMPEDFEPADAARAAA